ncbi:MAG: DUF4363 family protein [Clostridia bacterium]|nr:DUF4363 family protein [Clostridia bacterium]
MKRQLFLTLFLLAFTLLLGIVCEFGGRHYATLYQNDMLPVAAALAEEDWDEALRRIEIIRTNWKQDSRIVQLWVNHADIDHVSEALISLLAAVITRDLTSALDACGQCVENFGHLHHRDAFTLRNIL